MLETQYEKIPNFVAKSGQGKLIVAFSGSYASPIASPFRLHLVQKAEIYRFFLGLGMRIRVGDWG